MPPSHGHRCAGWTEGSRDCIIPSIYNWDASLQHLLRLLESRADEADSLTDPRAGDDYRASGAPGDSSLWLRHDKRWKPCLRRSITTDQCESSSPLRSACGTTIQRLVGFPGRFQLTGWGRKAVPYCARHDPVSPRSLISPAARAPTGRYRGLGRGHLHMALITLLS